MTDVAPAAAHVTSILHANTLSTALIVTGVLLVVVCVLAQLARGNW